MDKKLQWADEVLESLNGIQRAKPSNELFDKIMLELPKNKQNQIIPLKRLRWIAAAACLVVGLNVVVFSSKISTKQITENTENYHLINDYSLYE